MIGEASNLDVQVSGVLQKFEGDALPENEYERIHIENGEITKIEKIENGEVISTEYLQ